MTELFTDAECSREICEIIGRGHHLAAGRSVFWHRALGVSATILTTLVGTSIFTTLEGQPSAGWRIIAGTLSLLAAILASVQTTLKLDERSEHHRLAGSSYRALMRDFQLFKFKFGSPSGEPTKALNAATSPTRISVRPRRISWAMPS